MSKISNITFNIFSVLFFAFCLSFMLLWNQQMTGEESGSRVWMIRTASLLGVYSLYGVVANPIRKHRPIHLICLLWLLIMPIIMYLNHVGIGDYAISMLWPLLFEMTYLCCLYSERREVSFRTLFFIIAIVGVFFFIQARMVILSATNTIYFCFLTLPWLLLKRGKNMRLTLIIVFSFLALFSLKRSMMLTTVLIWMFFYIERIKKGRNLLYVIVGFGALLVISSQVYDRVDNSLGGLLTERVTREETDSGHNRMAIWELTIAMIQNSSFMELIVGHGPMGVRKDSFLEISAHNDFLEIIYDYGLIIFALYLCLWIYIVRRCYFLYRNKSPLFFPYAVSLSILIVMSMVSMLLPYGTYFNYLVMFWGMTEAHVESLKLFQSRTKKADESYICNTRLAHAE